MVSTLVVQNKYLLSRLGYPSLPSTLNLMGYIRITAI
jgi:hypothetical protein